MFRESFRGKIILPTILIVSFLVIGLISYSSSKFFTYHKSIIDETITANISSLRFYLDASKKNAKAAATSMALNVHAIKAIQERNREEILRIFSPAPELYRISYYTVCDNEGIVLARTYQPDYFGDSIANQQNVQDALGGKIGSYFESGTEVKVAARTGAPVYDADGALIGVVSAGVRFDVDSEVDALKKRLNSDITVFFQDTRIATTLMQNGQRAKGTTIDPAIAKIVIEGRQEYLGDTSIFGVEYRTFYTPLFNAGSEVFAVFFLGMPLAELKKASDALLRDGIIIGAIGLAVSIMLLLAIISSISRPLVTLANDMDNVAAGNLHISANIQGEDEIGRLSKALHGAVSIVHKLIEDITVTIAEQKKGNTEYCLDPGAFHGDYKTLADSIVKLANLGSKDQLTGLPNRHSFDNRLDFEWKRAIREKTPLSILLIDVDRFKNYNDLFGHQQGDVALQTLAGVYAHSLNRAADFTARWGGEEFTILLPNTDSGGALKIAEHIREKIEKTSIPCVDARAANITVSVGVHTQIPDPNSVKDDFIAHADKALYKAKAHGRNKVMLTP